MKTYTVKEIANILKTNEETVRRWIRSGKLKAIWKSKKEGNIISSEALQEFIKEMPKYTSEIMQSPLAISVMLGGLLASMKSIVSISNTKKKNFSAADIKKFLDKKIKEAEEKTIEKTKQVDKLMEEIKEHQKTIEKYKYALEKLDLELIAKEINDK